MFNIAGKGKKMCANYCNRQNINKTDFCKSYISVSEDILKEMKKQNVCADYFQDRDFTLINGDCITVMNWLISKCVRFDHIITDIPYGTVQGLSLEGWKNKGNIPDWDIPIDKAKMIEDCFYITKANANVLLFSQEPMTYFLLDEIRKFQKYSLSNKMIWVKNNHANSFSAKTTPVNIYEEILLFRKSLDETNSVELRNYFKDMLDFIGLSKKEIMNKLGQGLDHCFRYANRTFYIPTEKNYNALISEYHIDNMPNFIPYPELQKQWADENDVIFNIPRGQNLVHNVLSFKKDTNNIHPTQKPISLLSELIKIFTNEHETILDFTSGSGSTGIAAVRLNRKFVGIELDPKFFQASIEWYKKEFKESLF